MTVVQAAVEGRKSVTGNHPVRALLRMDEAWQAEDWRRRYLTRIPEWIVDTISENEVTARLLVDHMVERGVDHVLLAGQSDLTFAVVAELAQRGREARRSIPTGRRRRSPVSRSSGRPRTTSLEEHALAQRRFGNTRLDRVRAETSRGARRGGGRRGRRVRRARAGLQRRRDRRRPAARVAAGGDVPAAAGLLPAHRGHRPGRRAAAGAGPRVRLHAGRRPGPTRRQLGADRAARARGLRPRLPRPRRPGPAPVGRAGAVLPRVQRPPGPHRARLGGRRRAELGRQRRRPASPPSDEQLDEMARREHESWLEHHQRNGWTWAPTRDRAAKKHPDLLPWDQLSDESRAKTRKGVVESLALLETLGYRSFDDPYATWVRFRRRGEVTAVRRDEPWTWTTSDGTAMHGQAGDWEVTDDGGAARSVAAVDLRADPRAGRRRPLAPGRRGPRPPGPPRRGRAQPRGRPDRPPRPVGAPRRRGRGVAGLHRAPRGDLRPPGS